jgi:hypothetical protein
MLAPAVDTGFLDQRELCAPFETLNLASIRQGLSEIELAAFAMQRNVVSTMCAFAILFDLPVDSPCRALKSTDPSFIVMACKAHKYAWSSVEALLKLQASTCDLSSIEFLMDTYQLISFQDCERLFRLSKMHLLQKRYAS